MAIKLFHANWTTAEIKQATVATMTQHYL